MDKQEPQLKAKVGELHMKIQVTRATGKVEEFDLVGNVTAEQARELGLEPPKE